MLLFVQPILLWAAAGIIVPVVIHLWNIKQGKTLKVGSIAFITENAKSQASSFKLSQWLLLLLRCLLIVVLAMLIAQPYFDKPSNEKEGGWIVIDKSGFKQAYHAYKPMIDSLQRRRYTLHYFNEKFEDANWKDTLRAEKDTAKNSSFSYWALLKALNEKAPANLPVCIFTDHLLQHFSGNRPQVSLRLNWYAYPAADTATTWLQGAYQTSGDSIKVIVGKSNAFGTYYTYKNLARDKTDIDDYKVIENSEKINAVASDSLHQVIAIDTATLFITIYTNKYFADANYLKAALEAIKDFTQQKMKVTIVNNVKDVTNKSSWLFWLSEDALPKALIKTNVLLYEKGSVKNVHSVLLTNEGTSLTTNDAVALYQCIQSDSISFQPVWKNGFGEPVLSKENNAPVYHFYSHFNPQWSDLVWSPAFPQILYNLLFDTKENANNEFVTRDRRVLDTTQVHPVFTAAQLGNNKETVSNKQNLSKVFWVIAFLLFVIERIISFRQTRAVYE